MPELLWGFDKLSWFARSEDPEVRYWATERLVRFYPERAASAVALLVLDEHESTPELVADNLREHGGPEHIPLLLRAFKQMRGLVPGRAFEALARLEYPRLADLTASAVDLPGVSEPSLALVIGAAAASGDERARAAVRAIVERKVEILAEPRALKGALEVWPTGELPALLTLLARALQWRGLGGIADLLRVLTDHIEADDCGWCLRTGPDGRLDLRKTIKAVESGYDCEIEGPAPALSPESVRDLALTFRSRDHAAAIAAVARAVGVAAGAVRTAAGKASSGEAPDPLPERIAGVAAALASKGFMAEAERLGPSFQQGIVSVLMSCLVKLARYRNYARAVEAAGADMDALLGLAEQETAFLLDRLPAALARAVEAAPEAGRSKRRERILEWCRRMLEARGPFFPKAVALETIGELRADDHVPELLDFLSDENSYVFSAAEKALSQMGEAVTAPVRARLEAGALDHEALHSLLILLVEQGTRGSLALMLDHFDDFVERIGPGETAEWTALTGARELFDRIYRLLPMDVPRVGQALLLLGAIHNLPVAEEAEIHQAIEDYWKRHPAGAGGEEEGGSGSYVM